jgi:hypothetical protein
MNLVILRFLTLGGKLGHELDVEPARVVGARALDALPRVPLGVGLKVEHAARARDVAVADGHLGGGRMGAAREKKRG